MDKIQAYVCDEGLARFCTVPYEAPTKSNFKKAYMHLTNYSVNKLSEDYVRPEALEDVLEENQHTKRTLTSLYKTLARKGIDVNEIKTNINSTCSRIMQQYGPLLEHQVKAATGNKPIAG